MTRIEYCNLIKQKEEIEKKIREYESGCFSGCLRFKKTRGGIDHRQDMFLLSYSPCVGMRYRPLVRSESIEEMINDMEAVYRDLPDMIEKVKVMERQENNDE